MVLISNMIAREEQEYRTGTRSTGRGGVQNEHMHQHSVLTCVLCFFSHFFSQFDDNETTMMHVQKVQMVLHIFATLTYSGRKWVRVYIRSGT
jgi:hypothetical protein